MAEETQRKLAAILAADVVGYSRLMEADEAGTLATMKAHRAELWEPLTKRHSGRVVGTAGDSLLVEFASAVAAVECAVAVQRGMIERNADQPKNRHMQLRIGVNIGEVIVDGDDIYGDGVNLAARLESLCEPSGISLSSNVYEQVQGKLDAHFEDAGQHEVKNIARPVSVWRWSDTDSDELTPTATEPLALPDKPSIAVLPFDNMSGDPEQEYFADGITEDIITALSKFRWFFVSARNSSFTYKGQAVDLKQVGRDLGVRYVLEGSVRKAGSRVRITAQLVEAESGNHIWAERYDRELIDIFDLQDEMQQAIAAAVEPELASAEFDRAARKPPENLDAWDRCQQGLWHLNQRTKKDTDISERLFAEALDLDPSLARAYAGLARSLIHMVAFDWLAERSAPLTRALELSAEGLRRDARDPYIHDARGRALAFSGEIIGAIGEHRVALELNPNSAYSTFALGEMLLVSEQYEAALELFDQALRLSPRDPMRFLFICNRAICLHRMGLMAEAEENYRQSAILRTDLYWPRVFLAAFLIQQNRPEEAQEIIEEILRDFPDLTVDKIRRGFNPVSRSLGEPFLARLAAAGLPE